VSRGRVVVNTLSSVPAGTKTKKMHSALFLLAQRMNVQTRCTSSPQSSANLSILNPLLPAIIYEPINVEPAFSPPRRGEGGPASRRVDEG
jgi:hypothetical protein